MIHQSLELYDLLGRAFWAGFFLSGHIVNGESYQEADSAGDGHRVQADRRFVNAAFSDFLKGEYENGRVRN